MRAIAAIPSDTAASISLFVVAGTLAPSLPWYAVMVLPVLFTAGILIPGLLSALYGGLVMAHFAGAEGGGYSSLGEVRALFASDEALLAGWVHYLAFDLAIGAMIAQGEREIVTLYVIGPGHHLCTPCGDCRQRIREFATPSTQIMVLSKQGDVLKTYTMDSLLPDAFGPEQLPER